MKKLLYDVSLEKISHHQKYELTVLKANGLSHIEIMKMNLYQCLVSVLKMILCVFLVLLITKCILYLFHMNFVILSIINMEMLLLFILIDYVLPSVFSLVYICYFDVERILRF